MELKGKNVFITGSTRGIGLAMAHKFASLGANIVLNGRREIDEELVSDFQIMVYKWFLSLVMCQTARMPSGW